MWRVETVQNGLSPSELANVATFPRASSTWAWASASSRSALEGGDRLRGPVSRAVTDSEGRRVSVEASVQYVLAADTEPVTRGR